MSWRASAYVKGLRTGITRGEKLLLLCLADYYDDERRMAWPTVMTLAGDALMSERQARQCIGALERKGLLSVERTPGRSNAYGLPCLAGENLQGRGAGIAGVQELQGGGADSAGGWCRFCTYPRASRHEKCRGAVTIP